MRSFFPLLGLALLGAVLPSRARATEVNFNRDIRPILANHCWQCHGPDEKQRKAGLRLDARDGATQQRKGNAAVVPGKPEQSELVTRIFADEGVMPPPKVKKPLSKEQKELLRRWVAEGARYQDHWAFQPVVRPKPPAVKNAAWAKNDLDRFILARLEEKKVTPSPEADRPTLLRRVSLDLTGLLPTPEEVEEFVKDTRPDAYERVVERLLVSPHYGERWARHWLDQARYADSNGYTIDGDRTMWPYRDWVIRALNDDMPFDQFTVEQLAGDLLPKPTKLQLLATAFHRNTMINEEGGTDAEQFRNESVVDRVNTTGAVWLGLTVGCAQCHSHKYDPISHREYYQLFAFFNQGTDVNNRGATIDVALGEVFGPPRRPENPDPAILAAKERLETLAKTAAQRRAAWEKRVSDAEPRWSALDVQKFEAVSNRTLRKLDDGSILADRAGAPNDVFEITAATSLAKIGALRLEVLPHDSLPMGGPGTASNGNFVLTEIELLVGGKAVPFAHAVADHAKDKYAASAAIDGDRTTGWALEMTKGGKGAHEAWFLLDKPIAVGGKPIVVRLRHDVNDHYLVGCFRLSVVEESPVSHPDRSLWKTAVAAAGKAPEQRTTSEKTALERAFADMDTETAQALRIVGRTERDTVKPATVMVMRELEKPRQTHILLRGDFLNPDRKTGPLKPDTPACLPPLRPAGTTPNRLDLARWLVRSDNPLTPRVAVNRVWMHYFGEALVENENDFGTQGTPPTHPELLDWLAAEFVSPSSQASPARGEGEAKPWSLKQLHRLIATSATYRQASRHTAELREADPRNQLLARQNRLRLDAEGVRDVALCASGLLDRTLGGPTVRPPQPDGVYAFTQVKRRWLVSTGPDRYRRALYTTFYRSAPHPLFSTFDVPGLSTVCTRRVRSNTPLQALTLANDEMFVECTQALALRLWREVPGTGDDADRRRVVRAFRLCYSREPSAREADAVLGFVKRQAASFATDTAAARDVAPAKLPTDLTTANAAAWTAAVRALLNTDEFITRE
jgi:hypothetical protein